MQATDLPNLASAQLGAKILFATDEWFAAAGMAHYSILAVLLDILLRLERHYSITFIFQRI